MTRIIVLICLWIARAWMLLTAGFFSFVGYLLFFGNPNDFDPDSSISPDSPLLDRCIFLGFILPLFLFGLLQHWLLQKRLKKLDEEERGL